MPIWPAQLPHPALTGYSLEPQSAFIRSDMDAGPARQRRRYTAVPTQVSAQVTLTREQFALFEAWYEHRIQSGAAWFDAPIDNGLGVQSVSTRFVSPWKASAQGGGRYLVQMSWETRDRPVMSDAELTAAGVL